MLTKSDLMYELPENLIAQKPPENRGSCRLMVLDRANRSIEETMFPSVLDHFHRNDLLVLNDTRVIPARLRGRRVPTGGAVELLLLEKLEDNLWKTLVRPGKRCGRGNTFSFENDLSCRVVEELGMGRAVVEFSSEGDTGAAVEEAGRIPLPPYIKREVEKADLTRYQTVFASRDGAVAAPTAGLHFTETILRELGSRGVGRTTVTLHVGPGTFQPLRKEILSENTMEGERFTVPEKTLKAMRETREKGGRVIATGTTVTRTLESIDGSEENTVSGTTEIFIHPPYSFRNVDVLLTNFHLPGSSLISLVGSFAGLDFIMDAYHLAVQKGYMFYSYGDAMLIL